MCALKFICILFCTTLLFGCQSNSKYIYNDTKVFWVKPDFSDRNHIKGKKVPMYGVDIPSFKILKENVYALDNSSVYYYGIPIAFAQPSSFKPLNRSYAIDSEHVFLDGELLIDAKPNDFTFFKNNTNYSKSNDLLFYKKNSFTPCDAAKFQPIPKHFRWATDQKCVYFENQVLAGVDVNSFLPVNFQYAKDKYGVFYKSERVSGIDISSFKVVRGYKFDARDSLHCYRAASIVDCQTGKSQQKLTETEVDNRVSNIVQGWLQEKRQILAHAQREQNTNIARILNVMGKNAGTEELGDIKRFDRAKKDSGLSLVTTDLMPERISFQLDILNAESVRYKVFNSSVYGVMSLEFDADGKIIEEPVYTSRGYEHRSYRTNKCSFRVGMCIEDFEVISPSVSYKNILEVNSSYQNGVWRRAIKQPNGSYVHEIFIYNRLGLPVYYSKSRDEQLEFEMMREDLKLLTL